MIVVQFELNLTALASPETVTSLICNNRNKGGCVVFWPQLAESYPTRDWTCTPCVGSTVSTTGLRDRSFVLFFEYMKGQCEGNLVLPRRGRESRRRRRAKYHVTHLNKNGAKLFVVQSPNCVQHWQPHGLQHARLLCPSLSSGVCSNSCPLSCWCCLTTSSDVPSFAFNLSQHLSFPMSQLFTSSGKHWSFSISPSSEYSGLISFRIDWFDLAVKGTLKSRLSNLILLLR